MTVDKAVPDDLLYPQRRPVGFEEWYTEPCFCDCSCWDIVTSSLTQRDAGERVYLSDGKTKSTNLY